METGETDGVVEPWKIEGFRVNSLQPSSTCRELMKQRVSDFLHRQGVTGQRGTVLN